MRLSRGGPAANRSRRLLGAAFAAGLALLAFFLPESGRGQPSNQLLVQRPLIGWQERVPTWTFDGERYLRLRDLARIAECSYTWRGDVEKALLRAHHHTLKFTSENRFVVVDENRTVQLTQPVRLHAGELYLPIAAISTTLQGLIVHEAKLDGDRLTLMLEEPNADLPVLTEADGVTRFAVKVPPRTSAGLLSPQADRFVVRVPHLRVPPLVGDTLAPTGLVEHVQLDRQPSGLSVTFRLSPRAVSYRLRTAPTDSLLEVAFAAGPKPSEFVELSREERRVAPRPFYVLVLDPGHGGADSGFVAAPGVREKDITLALARRVRWEVSRLLPGVQVLLTRDGDRGVTLSERVQLANREHADLYVSLHVDGMRNSRLAGVTAYVAPPLEADRSLLLDVGSEVTGRGPRRLRLVGWQRAAGRHHSEARAAAQSLLDVLARDGYGPARLRVARSYPTQGADCPSVLLECGSLSAAPDLERLTSDDGVAVVARSIARALAAYAAGGS